MEFFTFTILGIAGLVLLVIVYAIFVFISRPAGALIALCMSGHERSAKHAKRYGARVAMLTFGVLTAGSCYGVYNGVYPPADFYLDEMESVTARPPPADATVLANDSTYPDFHGDYCSFSRIRLSETSYRRLLNELTTDKRFTVGRNGAITTGRMATNNLRALRVSSAFVRADVEQDHYYAISFLQSAAEIEVYICVN